MIYLDVTDSCRSPMNTGIQRVVRGIFRTLLAARAPVTPLLWDDKLASYCTLSRRERKFLEHPFAGFKGHQAWAEPGRTANPIPIWSKFWRGIIHWRNRVDLVQRLTANDVLFVPQIFRDHRLAWLTELAGRTSARRAGLFHDAIPWRRPDITPAANATGAVDYMLALASFDALITPSQEGADDLRACWRSHAVKNDSSRPPIQVLNWPVDESFAAPKQAAEQRPLPALDGVRKILCVGTLEPRKNHLTLLAAAEQLWRSGQMFELVLVGRTTREFGPRVRVEIECLRRAGRSVEWKRHVDDATLLAAYEACVFTVFPSLMEGFGLPIIESLRCGRPCVCGSNGALGEVAAGGGCLTVDQTNVGELAEALRRLLHDETLYGRLCAEAKARQFETWQSYGTKLLSLLTGNR